MEITDKTAAVTPNRTVKWLFAVLLACVVALESGCAGSRQCGTCNATQSSLIYRRCERCRDLIATRAWNNYDCHGFEPTSWEPWPYDCPAVVVARAEEVLGEEVLGEELLGENVLGENVLGENVLGENVLGENVLGEEVAETEEIVEIEELAPAATDVGVESADQDNQDAGGKSRHSIAAEATEAEQGIEETPVDSPTNEPSMPPLPSLSPPFLPLPPLPPEPTVEYEPELSLSRITSLEPMQLIGYNESPESANLPIESVNPIDGHRRGGQSSEVQNAPAESKTETPKIDIEWDPPFFDPTLTRERLEVSSRRNR